MRFSRGQAPVDVPLLSRSDLAQQHEGPLAVEEADTTVIVPPALARGRRRVG